VTFALHKKKTVAIGINSIKTHPNIPKFDYVSEEGEDLRNIARMHSEFNCILKLQNKYGENDMSDITFVNIRLDKMGNVRYAKPCNGCSHLLSQVGFKKLYYSLNNGEFCNF
jgi:tRNA(Arg) A34 adenosine deaminase TadA